MIHFENPWRCEKRGLLDDTIPAPSADVRAVSHLLKQCPAHRETPLVEAYGIAERLGVTSVHVKDERSRMGLGSFKALGAAYVIACDARESGVADMTTALQGRTYVCASAGNHGLSVAAGARIFGAQAVIYLAKTVPPSFIGKLEAKCARVVVEGDDYEPSMMAAMQAAADHGWDLLSDSSWSGYVDRPYRLMEGYLQMAEEAFHAMPDAPTHIVLQAGVGGLAGAVAALARTHYGDGPTIIVVEPDAAPALAESVRAGRAVATTGPVSNMGRLDCKTPSLIALKGVARDADWFVTIGDNEAETALGVLDAANLATTPSGGAGLACVLAADECARMALGINQDSRILAFVSEALA